MDSGPLRGWTGTSAIGGKAERAGILQPGEKKTQGRSHQDVQIPAGRL